MINIHDGNAWGYSRIFKVYSREGDLYMWFYDNDDEVVSSLFVWNVCYSSRCIYSNQYQAFTNVIWNDVDICCFVHFLMDWNWSINNIEYVAF